MKFDKKVLGSGFVAAFSLFLTVASVSGDHVTTKTEPGSQTVELTAEPIPKSNKVQLVSAEVKQDNKVKEVKEAAITDQSKAEAEEKKEDEPEKKTSAAQKKEEKAEVETTEKEEAEVETKAEKAEAEEKKEIEPQAKEEKSEAEKIENEPEAKVEQAETTEKEEKKADKVEVAETIETEAEVKAEKADGEEKTELETEKKTKASKKAKKKKKKQAAEEQEIAKNELVESGMQEVSPWAAKLMPNVEEYLNIRTEASEESELAGKIHRGAVADILEQEDGWTKISSGSVEGYVKDEYCVTGLEAESLANELGTTYATATTGGVRVRQAESSAEDTPILDVLEEGGKIKVDREAEAAEGWVPVKVDDQVGYISEEFVTVELELGKAISIEEEQAAIAAAEAKRKAEQEAAQQQSSSENSSSGGSSTQQREAMAASYDDVTLLGALIQCEAGSEPYEGQLAVGAVVMNRLRCGYAGSISGVIYQSGQFTPASNGMLSGVLSSGVSGSCMQAAQEAINGVDNVNGATSFRRAGSAEGLVIGNHVFF